MRGEDGVTQEELTNLKFHLSMLLVSGALGRSVHPENRNDIEDLVDREFNHDEMCTALGKLRASMKQYLDGTGLGMDRAAKTSDLSRRSLMNTSRSKRLSLRNYGQAGSVEMRVLPG